LLKVSRQDAGLAVGRVIHGVQVKRQVTGRCVEGGD